MMDDLRLHGLIGGTTTTYWQPPSDWINIDNVVDGNINLLVSDTTLATYAFACTTDTGQYSINWGDGTTTLHDSATKAEHTYTVGTGQSCSRGYTTFKIVISPVGGNLLTFKVDFHSLAFQSQEHGILWCVCGATHLISLANAFYNTVGGYVACKKLEAFKCAYTMPAVTDVSYMFQSCYSLQSIDISGMTALTSAGYMLNGCYSLRSIDISGMTALTDASYMFYSCHSLQSIDISGMTALTSVTNMLNGCCSLQNVNIGNLLVLTSASYMFQNCYSLQSIDISGMTALTSASHMFDGCCSLQNVNIGNLLVLTSASYMFQNCYSLQSIDISGMTALTSAGYMLNGCYSLRSIDISGMTALTEASYMFQSCYSLQIVLSTNLGLNATLTNAYNCFSTEQLKNVSLPNAKLTAITVKGYSGKLNKLETLTYHVDSTFSGTSPQIDIRYNTLTAEQLNTIFTALPTLPGKFISITGCTGASTCDTSIATSKGWTVTT